MTEPTFCVCNKRKGLLCAYHAGNPDPESRFRVPMTETEILAFAVIWTAIFGVGMVLVWTFNW